MSLSRLRDFAIFAWLVISFLLFVVAYVRLFRQAWQMPNRREAMKKVVHVQPYKNREWPNTSKEARLIAIGAGMGLITFTGLGVLVAIALIRGHY